MLGLAEKKYLVESAACEVVDDLFFFALKRDMWRGFSAEGAQHQMKQHIRSHKEPAPQLMLLFKQWKLWTDELLGLLASKAGSIRHKEIPGWMMQAVNEEKLLRLNIHRGLTVKLFRGVMQFAWIVEAFFLLHFMSLMATTRIRKSWKFSC